MERIQALVDKLYQQKQQNSSPAQLLFTVQLLQTELLQLQYKNGHAGSSKVAVTLPVNMNFSEEVIRPVAAKEPVPAVQKIETPAPKPEPAPQQAEIKPVAPVQEQPQPVVADIPPAYAAYALQKPVVEEVKAEPVAPPAPQPVYETKQVLNPAFTAMDEAPTLVQHQVKKDVNQAVANGNTPSLNDRLKQDKTEVAHVLKDTPIKDLRKGIGINDRFTFVTELFRGDEAMYERSIKTINGFHILSEAEYWINRELKFKLGWNDTKETVQHFYQLVRRRFA